MPFDSHRPLVAAGHLQLEHNAIGQARPHSYRPNLAHVKFSGLEKIFQKRLPVLVGAEIRSTYYFFSEPRSNVTATPGRCA